MRNAFRSSETIRFTALALIMMILVKVFIVDGVNSYRQQPIHQEDASSVQEPVQAYARLADIPKGMIDLNSAPPKEKPAFDFSYVMPQPESIENKYIEPEPAPIPEAVIVPKPVEIPKPQWDGKSRAKIAIIIDDMGLARKYTRDVIDLPAPMTLAFLPYANNLQEFTVPAKQLGHELIIHVPMEPMNSSLDLGPAGLTTKLDKAEFMRRLNEEIFNSFEGYVGINNHMGSRLTQDERAMSWLMPILRAKGLLFVDSKTIHTSIAGDTARKYGVDYAERDVFLDHNESLQSVLNSLGELERVARRKGSAIAIGHPKKNTIQALKMWMPTMAERGLVLVPASDLVYRFKKDDGPVTLLNDFKSIPGRPESGVLSQSLPPG